jgi:hypothetical protein
MIVERFEYWAVAGKVQVCGHMRDQASHGERGQGTAAGKLGHMTATRELLQRAATTSSSKGELHR